MQSHPTGYKRYERVHPQKVLDFIIDEISQDRGEALGEYRSLSRFDLARRTCYLITCDGKTVGFLAVRFHNKFENCLLTHIYIRPDYRRRGCAHFVVRSLKVNRVSFNPSNLAVRQLFGKLGFTQDMDVDLKSTQISMMSERVTEVRRVSARQKLER